MLGLWKAVSGQAGVEKKILRLLPHKKAYLKQGKEVEMRKSVIAKANARYQCQECGATELIQAHHQIPDDDNSLISLCAECHSRKHPKVPKVLFFSPTKQPYWSNKSASSLAKELGVHPRTIIRAAKKLNIKPGKLSPSDERLISSKLRGRRLISSKLQGNQKEAKMGGNLLTPNQAAEFFHRAPKTIRRWVREGKLNCIRLPSGQILIPEEELRKITRKGGEER